MKEKIVLVVEDDLLCISLLKFILQDICNIECCNSPDDCLEENLKKNFDLIIMDIGFKNSLLNGIDISKKIKSIDKYKNTPIIAFTAYGLGDIKKSLDNSKKEGIFEEVLFKPFEDIETFRDTIKKYLNLPTL